MMHNLIVDKLILCNVWSTHDSELVDTDQWIISSITLLMFEIDIKCIVLHYFHEGTNANDIKVTDLVDMKVVVCTCDLS